MNLLFTMPDWGWYAIIIGVALILIAIIIAVTCVQVKKNKKKNTSKSKAESETAITKAAEKPVKEETKPVKTEEKPKVEEKPKAAEKPAKVEEKPAEKEGDKVYHISKRKDDGKWQIKAEGATRALKLFQTQDEAIQYGKRLAENQNARIMIHKLDGSFRKLTY